MRFNAFMSGHHSKSSVFCDTLSVNSHRCGSHTCIQPSCSTLFYCSSSKYTNSV